MLQLCCDYFSYGLSIFFKQIYAFLVFLVWTAEMSSAVDLFPGARFYLGFILPLLLCPGVRGFVSPLTLLLA